MQILDSIMMTGIVLSGYSVHYQVRYFATEDFADFGRIEAENAITKLTG